MNRKEAVTLLSSNYCGKCREWTYASEEHPSDFTCEKCGGGGDDMSAKEMAWILGEWDTYAQTITSRSDNGSIDDIKAFNYLRKLGEWETELSRKERAEI